MNSKFGLILALCGVALAEPPECTTDDVKKAIEALRSELGEVFKEDECREIWDLDWRLYEEGFHGIKCSGAQGIIKDHFWEEMGCNSEDFCAGPDTEGVGMVLYFTEGCLGDHGPPTDLAEDVAQGCCDALDEYANSPEMKEVCKPEIMMIGAMYYGCSNGMLPEGCTHEAMEKMDMECPADCVWHEGDQLPMCSDGQEERGDACNNAACHDYIRPMIESEETHPDLECMAAIHQMYNPELTVDMLKMHLMHIGMQCKAFGEVDMEGCKGEDLCPLQDAYMRCDEIPEEDHMERDMCYGEAHSVQTMYPITCQMCINHPDNHGCGGDMSACGGGSGGDDECTHDCEAPPSDCGHFEDMVHNCLDDCPEDFLRPHYDMMGCDFDLTGGHDGDEHECHTCHHPPQDCDEFFEMTIPGGCADCMTEEQLLEGAEMMGCEDALAEAMAEREAGGGGGDDDDTDGADEEEDSASTVSASVLALATAATAAILA